MTFSKRLILAIVLSLMLGLQGCYKTVYKDKLVYLAPEDKYLLDCPVGALQGNTVKDALILNVDRLESIRSCNADKQALRTWKLKVKKNGAAK